VYCSKCGSNLSVGAAFCTSCGTPAGAQAAPAAMQPAATAYAGAGRPAYADPAGLAVSRGFTYAGFWLRFAACLIDSLILGIAVILVFVPLLFLTGLTANLEVIAQSRGQLNPAVVGSLIAAILVFAAIAILSHWLYYAYLESGERQGTWGKQVLGVYVTDLLGARIGFGQASGRFFARIVTHMIPLSLGFIMAGFTERKQALHDMIASCLVLRR
jgi:uncharacterized RDD family membrane protein YckC